MYGKCVEPGCKVKSITSSMEVQRYCPTKSECLAWIRDRNGLTHKPYAKELRELGVIEVDRPRFQSKHGFY